MKKNNNQDPIETYVCLIIQETRMLAIFFWIKSRLLSISNYHMLTFKNAHHVTLVAMFYNINVINRGHECHVMSIFKS